MRRRDFLACAPALAVAAAAPPVAAHAFNRRSNPPAGAVVQAAPPVLTLWFTEALEPRFCTLELRDERGQAIPIGPIVAVEDGKTLTATIPKLPAGRYTVIWHATSVDTHRTEGSYQFSVAP